MPPDEVVTELVLPVDTVESLWRTGLGSVALCCSRHGPGKLSVKPHAATSR